MNKELRPCPFCGGRAKIIDVDNKRLEVVGNIFDNSLEELQNETYH